MKVAVGFSLKLWSFNEVLSCLNDKTLENGKTDLINKIISLLKGETTLLSFTT